MVETDCLEFVLSWTSIPFYIIGFIGNVLVIRIVHKTREMHSTTNYLLANMAVSDVITILLFQLIRYLGDKFGNFFCKSFVIVGIAIKVSAITLTVLAVERYHALLRPFITGLRLSKENIKKAIAFIWVASVLICFPELFFQEWSETYSTCVGPWSLHINQASKIYMIVMAAIYYLQFVVMGFCYGSLITGLYFTNTVCPEIDEERSSEKKKLVITFLLATAGFFIGFAPSVVFYTVVALEDTEQRDFKLYSDLKAVFNFLLTCSLCLNPIIYAFRSSNFQEGFNRTLFCPKPTPQNEIQLR